MQTCCLGCGPQQPYYLLIKGAFQLNWVVNVNIKQGNGGIRKKPREQGVSQAAQLKLEAISSNLSFGPLLFMSFVFVVCFLKATKAGKPLLLWTAQSTQEETEPLLHKEVANAINKSKREQRAFNLRWMTKPCLECQSSTSC